MRKGTRHTEETIAKLRAAQLGKCLSPEHCAKISTSLSTPEARARTSLINKGKILSPETRAKLRAAQTRNMRSVEARARISAALKGKIVSEETRAKLRTASLGRTYSISPEQRTKMLNGLRAPKTRAKMRLAHLGKSMSEESRAKIRTFQTGRKHPPWTPETRAKQRLAHLGKSPTPETRAKLSARMCTPEAHARLCTQRAQRVISFKDTKPEVAVQTLLRDCGIEFTTHQRIPGLNHQWDIVIESKKILIEVDGCYWHGCSCRAGRKSYTNPNDIPCTTYAVAAGWTVIRIRECEINKENFSKLAVIK